jgi:pyruvate ferredoxin oxidoreductase beta subunit
MPNLKDLAARKDPLTGGHRACSGCGATIVVRQVLMSSKDPVVVTSATGCLEVVTTIFPYSAWNVPFLHNAFENSAATCSGIEAAYQALKRKGKVKGHINFVAFGGDGGTYDIGFQSLSGAMERGHDMLYVCYNNEAYMNTGIQRSSATPKGAATTTAPAGKVIPGKQQFSKNMTEIMVAHDLPYVAQSAVGFWRDLTLKSEKAFAVRGPKFLNVLQPCRLGWAYDPKLTAEMGRIAADTCVWPLYEVENGKYKLTYKPREKKHIIEFLKLQERFKHLLKPEHAGLIEEMQKETDRRWGVLLEKCGEKELLQSHLKGGV